MIGRLTGGRSLSTHHSCILRLFSSSSDASLRGDTSTSRAFLTPAYMSPSVALPTSCANQHPLVPHVNPLTLGLDKLSLSSNNGTTIPKYKLPPVFYQQQRLIIDPVTRENFIKLPTTNGSVVERFVPSTARITPMFAPSFNNGVIADPGAPAPTKHAISIITIRHKKMKKHKLRKLRKRMRFLRRKLEAVKAKKKEKVMQEYEKEWSKKGSEFNADHAVEQHLARAREAGWGIDPLAGRQNRSMSDSGANK